MTDFVVQGHMLLLQFERATTVQCISDVKLLHAYIMLLYLHPVNDCKRFHKPAARLRKRKESAGRCFVTRKKFESHISRFAFN